MRLAKPLLRVALLPFLLIAVSGCVDSILSPVGGGGPSGPEILVIAPDGTASWTLPPAPSPSLARTPAGTDASRTGDPTVSSGPGNELNVSATIDGTSGGRMKCGRFYLTVPAGAFDGPGTITMSMRDSTVMICDIEIEPRSLNSFREPVTIALCTNEATVSSDSLSLYWYDPEKWEWVDMGCDKDPSDDPEVAGSPYPATMVGVLTSLTHFSRYAGGKAGW